MFVVLSVERSLDQSAALLKRRQEVSLVLIDDVHDLKEQHFLLGRSTRKHVLLMCSSVHIHMNEGSRSRENSPGSPPCAALDTHPPADITDLPLVLHLMGI